MQYLLLFLEGIITFISPCILPMLPIYISYFAAGEADRGKALRGALGFVLGFTLLFTLMGAFAGGIGSLLRTHQTLVNIISGVIVIILALNFIGIIKIGFLSRSGGAGEVRTRGFWSTVLFGVIFAAGWTPCVGAFLGTAFMIAAGNGSITQGFIMLLVYSLGLGLPFIFSALLLDQLKAAFDFIKRNYRIINLVSGIFLLIIGILMATGHLGKFLALMSFQ